MNLADAPCHSSLCGLFDCRFRVLIPFTDQNPIGIARRIIKLPRLHGPDKGSKPDATQQQRYRYQDRQNLHHFTRNALSDTVIEDKDIAAAAARGVAIPAKANGTATTL